jgi:o-succinylbenzoate---CoA ligase
MQYNHKQFTLNHRSLSIQEILNNNTQALTDFETNTLVFVKNWLNGANEFSLQTSGSTGVPKAIVVTRAQLEASAQNTLQALRIQPNNTALICLNTQYIAGIMMLVRCMVGNLKMEIVEPAANPFLKLSANIKFDFCALIPYQVDAILQQYGIEGINRIQKIIIGGAPLSYSLQQKLTKSSSEIYLTYGMTETLSHIALQKISGSNASDLFTALPTIKLSKDERGCLVISVPYLSELVITNDMVELLSEQTFCWLGRWDNVINTGGIKIHAEKIEQVVGLIFEEMRITNDYFACGLPDERLGSKLVLIIEGTLSIDQRVLLGKISERLVKYEVPKQILFASNFIKTETGKVNRKQTVISILPSLHS